MTTNTDADRHSRVIAAIDNAMEEGPAEDLFERVRATIPDITHREFMDQMLVADLLLGSRATRH